MNKPDWIELLARVEYAASLPPELRAAYLEARYAARPTLLREAYAMLDDPSPDNGLEEAVGHAVSDLMARIAADTLPRRIGPYHVDALIGEGGMGRVYRAHTSKPVVRTVALKRLKDPDGSTAALARFSAEHQALAWLDHPHIARIYEAGEWQGRPYLAMEYVPGQTITAYCDTHGLDLTARIRLFCKVCDGVTHAHERGIIHRDLKPGNILVATQDGAPIPKIIDFGIAKAVAGMGALPSLHTASGAMLGTPVYMSPEQIDGHGCRISVRSDVYGLGAVLYALVCGRPPFDMRALNALDLGERLRRIREEDPPPPSTHVTGRFRRDLDCIVLKALARDPAARYASAAALKADCCRMLAHQVVTARGHGPWYRLGRFVRRHHTVVSAGLLVAAALAMGTFSSWRAWRQTRESLHHLEAVQQFLVTSFAAPHPDHRGRDIPMADVLDRAAARLTVDLPDQPRVAATLSLVIGRTYMGLGMYDEAQPLLESSWALRTQTRGVRPAQVREALSSLAALRFYQGRYAEAEQLYRRLIAAQVRDLPAHHADLQHSRRSLGHVLKERGRLTQAMQLYEDVVARQAADPDTSAVAAAETLVSLANANKRAGRLDAAHTLFTHALDIQVPVLGADHPDVLRTRGNLCKLLLRLGHYEEARTHLETLLQLRTHRLGADHERTWDIRYDLAQALYSLGRAQEALPLATRVAEARAAALGHAHKKTLSARVLQGLIEGEYGRRAQGIARVADALCEAEADLGPRHGSTRAYRDNLTHLLLLAGRATEAAETAAPNLVPDPDMPGDTWPVAASANLGLAWLMDGRPHEAEPLLAQAWLTAETTAHPARGEVTAYYAAALYTLGDEDEARALTPGFYENEAPLPHSLRNLWKILCIRDKKALPPLDARAPSVVQSR